MKNSNLDFCIKTFYRALIVFGLVYFSACLSLGSLSFQSLESAFISSAIYFFIELARKFKVKMPPLKSKKAQFEFLLFP